MNFNSIFKNAKWVTPSENNSSPFIRDSFFAENVKKAEISVCGLGFYYLYLNGKTVSEDLFLTLCTEYHSRKTIDGEQLSHRIIYQKYDVTEFICDGENAIGFLLGGGYYRYPFENDTNIYGKVKVCYKLDITDNNGNVHTFVSGEHMKWSRSFVKECDDFLKGETHDYRDFDENWCTTSYSAEKWQNVCIEEVPETYYETSDAPADRVISTGTPKCIFSDTDHKIYDVGENITGWVNIALPVAYEEETYIRFSEELNGNSLCEDNCYSQFFRIFPDGRERTIHPVLTWHGFRYVEVPSAVNAVSFSVIHSAVDVRTEFNSSNEVLNWIYKTYLRTQLNNMHCGIPSDCPTIERRGYTGDGQLCCESAMLLLDGKGFYKKWIKDIADSQDRLSGHIHYTAPMVPSGGGPGGWGCAIVEVPYVYYKTYGDTEVLYDNFDGMLQYFDFLDAHSHNGLVVSDLPDYWCLGDWCTAEEIKIPEPYVNTYFYIKSINRVIEIAAIIGKEDEIEELKERATFLKEKLLEEYYDENTGDFCNAVQGANAFALDIGLGDERTLQNLVSFYQDYQMFDTGIFGTEILLRVLFENNEAELAFQLLSSRKKYSFGNWMMRGATTFWEYWTGERSHDHPMFGASTRYLFQYILGIRQTENSVGYRKIIISPADISLESVNGTLHLTSGELKVSCIRNAQNTEFEITVPEGICVTFTYADHFEELKSGYNKISLNRETKTC